MGMQGRGHVFGSRCAALLMSLLLLTTAWQVPAVAAEGDVEEPAVAVEEVILEDDVANEELVPEQETQSEESQELVEPDQVEDDAAIEAVVPEIEEQVSEQAEPEDADSQLDGGLQVQSSETELSFADGAILVEGLSAGDATYDEMTNTLTLNAATMDYLTVNTTVTMELVGENRVEKSITVVGEEITLTFEGEGKLSYGHDLIAGEVGSYDDDGYYHYDNSAQPTGNVIVKGGTLDCEAICCKDFSISGGTVACGVAAGEWYDDDADKWVYSGAITMTGGLIDYYARAKDFTMSGGTVKGGVYANTITMKGGSVSGDVECTTLRMYEGATITDKGHGDYQPLISCTTFAMWGGAITLTNCHKGISAFEKFSLAGGTITVTGSSDGGSAIEAGTSFYMQGGTITTSGFYEVVSTKTVTVKGGSVSGDIGGYSAEVSSFTMSGGTVKGNVYAKAITMSKGTITGEVDCTGTMKLSGGTISYAGTGSDDDLSGVSAATLSMTGGTIKVSKCYQGIVVSKSLAMSKGTIAIASCDYGISAEQYANAKTANITIKGGKVTITNPSETGIEAVEGNITMTGGTVSITGSYGDALYAYGTTYRGTKYGGRIKVTGGKLTAKVRKPSQNSALLASYGVSNKATCLGSIAGQVSKGTSFKVWGNTYKLYDYSEVRLIKYESTKTSANLTTVKFGGNSYGVFGVASNAFATAQGKKLTSLSFGNYLNYLGSYAFKGTSSLTTLKLKLYTKEKWSGSTCKVTTDTANGTYAKTAFKGAGKNSGKGLTVRFGWKETVSAYRAYLRTLGLPSGAKVVGS